MAVKFFLLIFQKFDRRAAGFALAAALILLCVPAQARNRALLIAVAAYDEPAIRSLEGPRNDVLMVWRRLTRNGFAAKDIRVLAEGLPEGADAPKPFAPATRAEILAGLADLAARAEAGDFVQIHYSGHGATQPEGAVEEGQEPEPGGRAQALLPKDAGKYDPQARSIRNAIVDKELGRALDRIRAKGARVFVVIDACHAGTATRAGAGVARAVEAEALGVPQALAPSPLRPPQRRATLPAPADKAALVGFFAVDSWSEALERPLPGGAGFIGPEGAQKFGVFTWRLMRALEQGRARTYRELARLIALDMASATLAAAPPPAFEGDLDAPLPGQDHALVRARFPARSDNGALIVEAGQLHGLDAGARLALFDGPLADARALGRADVSEADAAASRAEVAGASPAQVWPAQLWAELETPAARLRLRVAATPEARPHLAAALAGDGLAVDLVEGPADMLASVAAGRLWLTRDGAQPVTQPAAYDRSPSAALDAPEDVRLLLWRFARAANLVRLAGVAQAGGAEGAARISLEVARETDAARLADPRRACAAPPQGAGRPLDSADVAALGHCDALRLSIENAGERDLDVGVFFLDPSGAVAVPARDWRQNGCVAFLPARATRPLVLRTQLRLDGAGGPGHSGLHRIVVFALPRQAGMPANLCHLAQDAPAEAARLRAAAGAKGFAALLARAGLADPSLRAANPFAEEDASAAAQTSVRLFTLDLRPPQP